MGMGVKSQQQLNRQFSALDGVSQALAAALQVREHDFAAAEHNHVWLTVQNYHAMFKIVSKAWSATKQ